MTANLYEFGPFTLQVSEHRLLRDGKPVSLAPRAFDILLLLVQNGGRLVPKDDLVKRVWPSGFVEEANLTANVAALRRALGPGPAGQEYIETVPRLGYRFNAGGSKLSLGSERSAGASAAPEVPGSADAAPDDAQPIPHHDFRAAASAAGPLLAPKKASRRAALVACAVAALAVFGLWLQAKRHPSQTSASAGARSIAVLPFQSLSSSPDQEYLGLGLPDALITRLGGLRQIVVRPTGSIRQYSAGAIDPRTAGQQLKVDSVLEGSVQRTGERIRVTVRTAQSGGRRSALVGHV
jgi:DNA-binding winged helix-turn-helix (wHTH) protein/TolB-like protein